MRYREDLASGRRLYNCEVLYKAKRRTVEMDKDGQGSVIDICSNYHYISFLAS